MKIPFYLLGLLMRYGPQHGYKLMQMIEERIADFAKIKLPTIYYHLQKMEEQGYIQKSLDKEGNRPEKFVYAITKEGINYYGMLYTKLLKESYSPEFGIDGVLFYSDRAEQSELLAEFYKKREEITAKINSVRAHEENAINHIEGQGRICTELIFEHHLCHLEAEQGWLDQVIKGLQ